MKPIVKLWLKRVALTAGVALALLVLVVTTIVESEGAYVHEDLGGSGGERALILYHPSRDAHFSDDLSLAVDRGFERAGLTVERATMTSDTPAELDDYAMIAVISNTYFWTPDRPTLRYLRRARLDGLPVIGLIGGAGATGRSERLLGEALRAAGARSVETHSYWLWRPNDDARMDEPNRGVAMDLAESLAYEAAAAAAAR